MPLLTDNLRSPAALARFLLTMIIGLGLDLWTKALAFANLAAGAPYHGPDQSGRIRWLVDSRHEKLIPGWLHFQVTVNEGAVFGIGQGQRWLFIVISVAAILFLSGLFSTSGRQRFYQFVLGLLLAGVLGNMFDRFRYGYVRDMIYALPGWKWPGTTREVFPWIFNVADVLLCVGVSLIFVYSLLHRHGPEPQTPANSEPLPGHSGRGDCTI